MIDEVFLFISILCALALVLRISRFRKKTSIENIYIINFVILGFLGSWLTAYTESAIAYNKFSGFSIGERWSGALLLCLLYSAYLFNRNNLSVSQFDLTGIAVCATLPIGKLGCFLSGHPGCYGISSDLPWAIVFSDGNVSSIVPVHPVQLYDMLFHLMLLPGLILMFKKEKTFGLLSAGFIFLIATSFYNIVIEFIRPNPDIFYGLSANQLNYILTIPIALATAFLIVPKSTIENILAENEGKDIQTSST